MLFLLHNRENVTLAFSSIATTGDFPIFSNTCGAGIAAGATCSVGVEFSPTATGTRTGELIFSDNAPNSPQVASLTGTGSPPVELSTTSLTFASRTLGTTSNAFNVTLTNHLINPVAVSTPVATGDFAVASNTCVGDLGAAWVGGNSCTVGVAFTPTVAGPRTGTLTIPYGAYGSPGVVALTGTGNDKGTGLLSIDVTPAYSTIGVGQTQQFTATGYFSGGSTQNLTASVSWSSSAPGVATINAAGLAAALEPGPTTIEAALGAKKGSTLMNVTSFVLTGSLNAARDGHTATLLNNGSVLVAGGSYWDDDNDSYIYLASAELYNPATGTFTPTGSMNTARSDHTATLLSDGRVLIAGGSSNNALVASAELYDPATGTFTPTGSLNTARNDHTATLLKNGMVLVAGGCCDSSGNELASAELYDPPSGTFTYAIGTMNTARASQTATLLNNGRVLIAGGFDSSFNPLASAELYDPATGTFSYTGTMNTARGWQTATLLNNGRVLMAGGWQTGTAELYDPTTGTFSPTGSLNMARFLHTATLLNNGMVLAAGGGVGTASAELYDPATGTFTYTGSMNYVRDSHTATLLNNGRVLMAGGSYEYFGFPLASAELYLPSTLTPPNLVSVAVTPGASTLSPGTTQQFIATGTFSDGSTEQLASVTWSSSDPAVAQISNDASNQGVGLAIADGAATITAMDGSVSGSATLTVRPAGFVYTGNLNAARYDHTATLLNNGVVLITGGSTYSGRILASAEVYNAAAGTFTYTSGGLNTARYDHTATLLSSGQVLIAGGHNAVTYLTDAELYDPASATFTLTGSLNVRRAYDTATLLDNGLVLIVGGYTYSSGYLASSELYNPATGTFTLTGNLNTARAYATATLLDDGTVLISGGRNSSGYLASAELYDPATGTFSYPTGSLNKPRAYHTATLLNNGLVLMAGGEASGYLASAELYNPATGTFTLTGSLNTARAYATATLRDDGTVLVAGGEASGYLASTELYNPATGTFTVTGNLNTARAYDTATLLNNGMVLVVGGENKSGALASAELF
jgi:hypothetical protein